jgi:hypothetical protein
VTGNVGDEYINTADRHEYIHDGSNWIRRPWFNRLVGFAEGRVTVHETHNIRGRWQKIDGSRCTACVNMSMRLPKVGVQTELMFEGYLQASASHGTMIQFGVIVEEITPGGLVVNTTEPWGDGAEMVFEDDYQTAKMIPIAEVQGQWTHGQALIAAPGGPSNNIYRATIAYKLSKYTMTFWPGMTWRLACWEVYV